MPAPDLRADGRNVNWFGHAHVARLAGHGEGEVVLGAVLPDLLGMVRARVDVQALPAKVQVGVALHHRADEAFHQHPDFARLGADLRSRLAPLGLPGGASRAIGHVGTELLLDGTLADDGATTSAFAGAMTGAEAVDGAIVAGAERWLQLRTWVAGAHPSDYETPAQVARRLERILARRPRLAFDAADVERLTEVLAAHRPAVIEAAPRLFADVTGAIRR